MIEHKIVIAGRKLKVTDSNIMTDSLKWLVNNLNGWQAIVSGWKTDIRKL